MLAVASVEGPELVLSDAVCQRREAGCSQRGQNPHRQLYFAVDYVTLPALPGDLGRFHAQYRQAAPCKSVMDDWQVNWDKKVNDLKNLDGKDNYVFLEATGRGHLWA